MDESSSRYWNKGKEIALSFPKKQRRTTKSITAKPKERKRGFGIAELERMRVEEEMMAQEEIEEYFKDTLSQPPIHGAGIQGLMTYGAREGISGQFKLPMISVKYVTRSDTSGAASYFNPNNTVPTTLHLFEAPDHTEYEYIDLKRKDDENLSGESTCKNFNDPQDLDLNLKL